MAAAAGTTRLLASVAIWTAKPAERTVTDLTGRGLPAYLKSQGDVELTMGYARAFSGTFLGASMVAACLSSPAVAFNAEADCEGIIISYFQLEEAASRMRDLASPVLSDSQREDILYSVGENTLSRYFGKNIAKMNAHELDAVNERFTACVTHWPGRFPLRTPKEEVLAHVETQLNAISEVTRAAAENGEKVAAEKIAAADLLRAQYERQAADEEARIRELTKKVEEAEAAKKRAEELASRRKALEERLERSKEVAVSQAPGDSEPEDESNIDDVRIEEKEDVSTQERLDQFAAYFQQFSIAKLCSSVDVNFSTSDIANLQQRIGAAINEGNIDRAKATEAWDRISRVINSNSSKLNQADCDQAYQWFTYALPDVELGTPSDFPF